MCENGAKDVVFLLLAKKAALEAMDLVSDLFIYWFCFVFFLILFSKNQRSPLYIACENGREDVVSLLLAKKADSGARDLVSFDFFCFCFCFVFFLWYCFDRMEEPPCILRVRMDIRMLYLFCWLPRPIWKSQIW